jgi:hypothetical protein
VTDLVELRGKITMHHPAGEGTREYAVIAGAMIIMVIQRERELLRRRRTGTPAGAVPPSAHKPD